MIALVRPHLRPESARLLALLEGGLDGSSSAELREALGEVSTTTLNRALTPLRRLGLCWPATTRLPTGGNPALVPFASLRIRDPLEARMMRHIRRRPRSIHDLRQVIEVVEDWREGSVMRHEAIRQAIDRLTRSGRVTRGQAVWLASTMWAP